MKKLIAISTLVISGLSVGGMFAADQEVVTAAEDDLVREVEAIASDEKVSEIVDLVKVVTAEITEKVAAEATKRVVAGEEGLVSEDDALGQV